MKRTLPSSLARPLNLAAVVFCQQILTICCEAQTIRTTSMDSNWTSVAMNDTSGDMAEVKDAQVGITIAKLNIEEVKIPLIICGVVLLAALSKVVFHHIQFLSSRVPESCLLIVIGVILGAILHYSTLSSHLPHFFAPHQFFLYLLPPIILEASFSLHDRDVFNNFGSILTFAVVGTVLACFAVGYTMYGLAQVGAMGEIELGAVEVLIFSSLIVAVDPVAVLAVFEEVGVNSVLYFMVFGESLLNDGVTVVLYNVMHEINKMDHIDGIQILLGCVTFIVVAGGGALVGIIIGVISAVVTKYTNKVRVVEPVAVFIFAYLSFIVADAFTLSGIISMIACGLVQMQYTFHNITQKSRTTIKYFTKVLSTATEIVIFLFLGLELFRFDHNFHVGFIFWAIALTLIYRFIITYGLTFLLNRDRYRVRKISFREQFIISYGGLRGAVAFSLVGLLEPDEVHSKQLFVTATLAVIIFTVFVQGITIKPFVRLFKVRMASTHKTTLFEEVMTQMTDSLMAGMENIIGNKGNYHLKELLEFYDDKYLKRWLHRTTVKSNEDIMRIYEKVVLRDHLENLYAGGARIPKSPEMLRALTNDPLEDIDFMQGGKTVLPDSSVEIEMEAPQRGGVSRAASMTAQDMIDILEKSGTNMIRRISDPEEDDPYTPDILHQLQDKHLKVQRFNRMTSRQNSFSSHGSWHGPRRRTSPFTSFVLQRPLSVNYDARAQQEVIKEQANGASNVGNSTKSNGDKNDALGNGNIASRPNSPNNIETTQL